MSDIMKRWVVEDFLRDPDGSDIEAILKHDAALRARNAQLEAAIVAALVRIDQMAGELEHLGTGAMAAVYVRGQEDSK